MVLRAGCTPHPASVVLGWEIGGEPLGPDAHGGRGEFFAQVAESSHDHFCAAPVRSADQVDVLRSAAVEQSV